jgi:hemerythrin-like domain-containing protein
MRKTNGTPPKDAITLLTEDHQRVRELLGEMEETTERAVSKREELLATIKQELEIHTKIEEDIFYPAFRDAAKKKDDKDLYALEEHHVVDMVMPEIKKTKADSEEFGAKAKVLKDLVEHHAGEEEKEMFPRAKKLMDREQLLDLGQQLAQARDSLMSEGAKARR